MIELVKGWILQNRGGAFLDGNFQWVYYQNIKEAVVHEGDEESLAVILSEIGEEVEIIYPAMIFNGHLLLGQPLRVSFQKFSRN